MARTRQNAEALRALDGRYKHLAAVKSHTARPAGGWIRATRDALGMTSRDLAARMGIANSTLTRLEQSERNKTIQLQSLQAVADALGCDVVYALVPRQPLSQTVDAQARLVAREYLTAVKHTMGLEGQALTSEQFERHVDELAAQLSSQRGLWST